MEYIVIIYTFFVGQDKSFLDECIYLNIAAAGIKDEGALVALLYPRINTPLTIMSLHKFMSQKEFNILKCKCYYHFKMPSSLFEVWVYYTSRKFTIKVLCRYLLLSLPREHFFTARYLVCFKMSFLWHQNVLLYFN